jgi:hypothetical protein
MKKYLIASAAAVMAASASVASAATVVVKFEGTVVTAYNEAGEFGPAGTNLVGDSFVTTFTYDNTAGQMDPISAVIALNGVTKSLPDPASYFHLFEPALDGQTTPSGTCSFCALVAGSSSFPPAGGFSFSLLPEIWGTLFNPILISQSANYELFEEGPFVPQIPDELDANSGVDLDQIAGNAFNTELALKATQVEVFGQLASAVPEPATWSSTIVGLGLAGLALRRRRLAAKLA